MLKTRHHASKEMEFIVFPTPKQPLAIYSPNTLTQIQTQEDVFSCCSIQVHQACLVQKWVQRESEKPRQSDDICCTKKSKKRLRRLLTFRASSKLPAYMTEVQLTLAQLICASRMQLKTAVEEMTAGASINQYS